VPIQQTQSNDTLVSKKKVVVEDSTVHIHVVISTSDRSFSEKKRDKTFGPIKIRKFSEIFGG
jgi:hypothetical protein